MLIFKCHSQLENFFLSAKDRINLQNEFSHIHLPTYHLKKSTYIFDKI